MDIVRFQNAPFYYPPNHDGVTARRLQGGAASSADFVLVGYSEFPPGVTLPMEAAPIGKIYVVTQGVICVEQIDGTRHRLAQWDSVFVPPNEARSVINDSGAPAAIIVVTPPPVRGAT
jgi:quercetin dioxygenase-like cupin family protein